MSNRKQPNSLPPARGNSARPNAPRVAPTRPQKGAPPPQAGFNPLYLVGGLVAVGVLLIGFLIFSNNNNSTTAGTTPAAGATVPAATVPAAGAPAGGPVADATAPGEGVNGAIALVETPKGSFKIQLFSDPAVKGAVKNFTDKATSGYFNDKIFHRVEDWVIQGGDPTGTGSGGGNMPGEYTSHPFVNGAVGMASTAGHAAQVNDSQWFVVKKDSTFLDNNYVIFGQVIQGMDVVNKIAIGDKMTKVTMQP
jgi:cyclophilin family peptidyl-prolyl cis-trans isomerase